MGLTSRNTAKYKKEYLIKLRTILESRNQNTVEYWIILDNAKYTVSQPFSLYATGLPFITQPLPLKITSSNLTCRPVVDTRLLLLAGYTLLLVTGYILSG